MLTAAIAQLGERQTEDLKVPGSIPGGGIFLVMKKKQGKKLCTPPVGIEPTATRLRVLRSTI